MLRVPTQNYVVSGGAVTATGTGTPFVLNFSDYDSFSTAFTSTLDSGTGTLDMYLQTQDTAGNWYDVVHYAQISAATTNPLFARVSLMGQSYVGAVGNKVIAAGSVGVAPLSNTFRMAYTVSGTVQFTPTITIYGNNTTRPV